MLFGAQEGEISSLHLTPNKFESGSWEYDKEEDIIVVRNARIGDRSVCYLTSKDKDTNFKISEFCEDFLVVNDPNPGVLEGTGTEGDPFTINSIEDLVAFGQSVDNGNDYKNKYIKLGLSLDFDYKYSYANYKTTAFGDINGDGVVSGLREELTTGKGFNPIGQVVNGNVNDDKTFAGTFLGNNKEIRSLYINNSLQYNGLFSVLNATTITDLRITNVNITTNDATGILAGKSYTASYLSNIHVQGSIKAVGGHTGGLIGYGYGTIIDSSADVNVETSGYSISVGGLVGYYYDGFLANNHVKGKIEKKRVSADEYSQTGGLIGFVNNSTAQIINNRSNVTVISGSGNFVDGLIGISNAPVKNCYSTGEVIAKKGKYIAGLVGGANSNVEDSYSTSTVKLEEGYSYGKEITFNTNPETGLVTLTYDYVGGLIGRISTSTSTTSTEPDMIKNVYYTGNVKGIRNVGGFIGGICLGTVNLAIEKAYVVTNVTATERNAAGFVVGMYLFKNVTSSNVATINNVLVAGKVSAPTNEYPVIYNTSDAHLSTNNLYRSSTLSVTNPTNNYGTVVNVNDLKTTNWYTNTLGLNNNWKLQNNYYPQLYKINDSGNPTTELLKNQVNKTVN